jgi:phytoene/squalene synthetase
MFLSVMGVECLTNLNQMIPTCLYDDVSLKTSKLVTKSYSTSFSIAVSFLETGMQNAIYAIYGFVRLADEIVDTFVQYDKELLLEKFERDYHEAFDAGISLNPVLHSFQLVVRKYNITDDLISAFLESMKSDLSKTTYAHKSEIDAYIYGSADVVGLMCLKVFTNGDDQLFNSLKEPAMKLGSAFQKVNFLRDLKNDLEFLDRQYFPEMNERIFNENVKMAIIKDIENDFSSARKGILNLPKGARVAVLIAFYYYRRLLKKIRHTPANTLISTRIRIPAILKTALLVKALVVNKLNLI